MKVDPEDLAELELFSGIAPQEIAGMLSCLRARLVRYSKNALIIEEDSRVYDFGIVLSGHARALKEAPDGRQLIITLLKRGSEIGVILAASIDHKSPVAVQAQDDVSVLQIPFERVIFRCEKACQRHAILLRNYINSVAEKGLVLHERLDCLLKPALREKIMTYLVRLSREQSSRTFAIPLDRKAMAEYLNADRSALSRELARMQQDGLIDYHKNNFKLL